MQNSANVQRNKTATGLSQDYVKQAENLQRAIDNILDEKTSDKKTVNIDLQVLALQDDSKVGNVEYEAFIYHVFFKMLPSVPLEAYSRNLKQTTVNILLNKVKEDPNITEAPAYVQEAVLWAKLGNWKSISEGNNGSYVISRGIVTRNDGTKIEGKRIGIFKPKAEEQLLMDLKKRLFFNLTPFGRLRKHADAGQAYVAEEASFRTSKFLAKAIQSVLADKNVEKGTLTSEQSKRLSEKDFSLVPETKIISIPLPRHSETEMVGSYQRWLTGDVTQAKEFYDTDWEYGKNKKTSKVTPSKEIKEEAVSDELLDLLAILDYVTGQCDRHADNFFIEKDENGKIISLRLIDGGWSFIAGHPSTTDYFEMRNMYLWNRLEEFDKPFTAFGRAVIDYVYQHKEELLEEVEALYNQEGQPKSITQARISAARDRIDTLKAVSHRVTKKELSGIRTGSEISYQIGKLYPHRWFACVVVGLTTAALGLLTFGFMPYHIGFAALAGFLGAVLITHTNIYPVNRLPQSLLGLGAAGIIVTAGILPLLGVPTIVNALALIGVAVPTSLLIGGLIAAGVGLALPLFIGAITGIHRLATRETTVGDEPGVVTNSAKNGEDNQAEASEEDTSDLKLRSVLTPGANPVLASKGAAKGPNVSDSLNRNNSFGLPQCSSAPNPRTM